MKPYSMDLRQRVLEDWDAGLTTKQVADKYRVRTSWVRCVKQRRASSGDIAPRVFRHGPKPSWDAYADRLSQAIGLKPDATLAELRDQLGLSVALSTLWRAVKALGLSVKKKSFTRPSRTAPM